MTTSEIILHHYPQSPVSEKVRVIFGMKGLHWRSVIIPRLPPRPNLTPLTGGYRLTPVMQIGADIYCDTHSIIRQLERSHPHPTLFPGGAHGMAWGVAEWTDGPMFKDVVAVALTIMADKMPAEFMADRGPLYFGSGFNLEEMKANASEHLSSVRTQLGWMDARLSSRDYMLGAEPGLPDALAYYLVWFLMDRMAGNDEFFNQFPNLLRWEARMRAIGNGFPTEMSDTEAMAIASAASPLTAIKADPGDPLGFGPGDTVTITPKNGSASIDGTIVALDADEIAISRTDPHVGDVCVHFPRMGYRVVRR